MAVKLQHMHVVRSVVCCVCVCARARACVSVHKCVVCVSVCVHACGECVYCMCVHLLEQ